MENKYTYSATFSSLEISAIDLLEASGNFDESQRDVLYEIAQHVVQQGEELAEIRAAITIAPAIIDGDEIKIGEVTLMPGRSITQLLKQASRAAVFICTAGIRFEQVAHSEMHSGDILKGYYTDLLGSLTVEKAMDFFQEQLKEQLVGTGLFITNRYSPGYCDWQVADQHNLFRLFPENCCGVTLKSSALMSPVKSVSGIIGVGGEVKYREHHCDLCNSKTCIYRNIRNRETKHSNL